MASSIDRLGSGLEAVGNEVAGVADRLGACREEALAADRAASDAEARLEQLGDGMYTRNPSALQLDLQGHL